MTREYFKLLFLTLYFIESKAMMIRNEALITKMISDFQKDNTLASGKLQRSEIKQPKNVLSLMQGVLCRNFPTIPCDMIIEDETLKTLIERSIQQLKYKKLTIEKTTVAPSYHLTLFPTMNSDDLSNLLQMSDRGYFSKINKEKLRTHKHRKRVARNNGEEKESKKKGSKKSESVRTAQYSGPKKIRKFYPHKIKYKDKSANAPRENFRDNSEDKLSMSVEVPEMTSGRKRLTPTYKMEPADPPVWRIDYMKHGEPRLNMFGFEHDGLNEKLAKTGSNVIVSDNMMEQASRKDVLHPDVYIKKNYVRKNNLEMNSGGID